MVLAILSLGICGLTPLEFFCQIPEYEIEVLAVDSGQPQMTGTVSVKITVTDINDNPPFFTQHNYTAVVQVGTWIYGSLNNNKVVIPFSLRMTRRLKLQD